MDAPIRTSPSPLFKLLQVLCGLSIILWVLTSFLIVGYLWEPRKSLSIGAGYVEYGYGWNWIAEKMPPGPGGGGLPFGFVVQWANPVADRTFAPVCVSFRLLSGWLLGLIGLVWLRQRVPTTNQATSLYALLIWAMIAGPAAWILEMLADDVAPFIFVPLAGITLLIPVVVRLSRRRRFLPGMCVTCGYNLFGNISGICPECGVACPGSIH